jgi:hypothetical protein
MSCSRKGPSKISRSYRRTSIKKLAMLIDDLKERGPISLNTAKKLVKLFNIPIGRLLT